MRHPLGVSRRVCNRHGPHVQDAKEDHSLQLEAVNHRLKVSNERVQRVLAYVTVGHADAPPVVADQAQVLRQIVVPATIFRYLPFALNMTAPEPRHVHERHPLADRPEGNIYAVGSRGVLNTRLHGASYATRFDARPNTTSERFPVYGNVMPASRAEMKTLCARWQNVSVPRTRSSVHLHLVRG